jgi:hypothetical protein
VNALPFASLGISAGQAGLGLLVLFCIAAIWAAAGPKQREHHNKQKD